MSKYFIILLVSLLLVGCSSKWNRPPVNTSEEFVTKVEESVTTQKEAIKQNPDDVDANFKLGFNYQSLGKYTKAIKAYEKVLTIDDQHFPVLNNLADIYEQVGEYDQAAYYIKQLYDYNQDNSGVVSDTVRILLENDEPDNAEVALNNFIKLRKEAGNPENNLFTSDLYDSIQKYRSNNK